VGFCEYITREFTRLDFSYISDALNVYKDPILRRFEAGLGENEGDKL
jgi:hypothetical protein